MTGSPATRSLPWARRLAATAILAVVPVVAGCGGAADDVTVTPGAGGSVTPTPSSPTPSDRLIDPSRGTKPAPTSPQPPAPGAAAGETDLTVVVDDGSGATKTWRLTCDPPGGTHPDPAAACEALAARGETALPPVPPDRMCTQQYGGPETAQVTGTWRGRTVSARFAKTNGCEIGRWNALSGLLPGAAREGA